MTVWSGSGRGSSSAPGGRAVPVVADDTAEGLRGVGLDPGPVQRDLGLEP